MLYIVKNTITNEVSEQDIAQGFIDNLLEKGFVYSDYIKPSQVEIDIFNNNKLAISLQNAKIKKIQELNTIYVKDSTWVFEVWSNKLSAGLIKDANWFSKMLPAVKGDKKTILFDKNNNIKQISITNDEALALNNIITIDKSVEIKTKNLEVLKMINNATSIIDIDNIDISAKFQEVDRFIDIDKIVKTNNGNGN